MKSNSFCAVNEKLRSALQHALNFHPELAACNHPACYNQHSPDGAQVSVWNRTAHISEVEGTSNEARILIIDTFNPANVANSYLNRRSADPDSFILATTCSVVDFV